MTDVQNSPTPSQPAAPVPTPTIETPPQSSTVLKKIIIAVGILLLVGLLGAAVYYLPSLLATKEAPPAQTPHINLPAEPTPTVITAPEATTTTSEAATSTEPAASSTPAELPPGTIGFGQTVQLFVGDEITVKDVTRAYHVKVVEFTDSRCPAGVQCIWAGERGVRLEVTNLLNRKIEDMRLGTVTAKTLDVMGLKGTLIEINDEKGGPYAKVRFD